MKILQTQPALHPAQFRQTLATSNISHLVSIFLAIILAYVQRDLIATTILIGWLSLIFLVFGFRTYHVKAYLKQAAADSATIAANLGKFRLLILASGISWGLAGILLFPSDAPQHQMFLIFILGGLTLGGVIAFSADLIAASAYAASALLPLLLKLFWSDGELYQAISLSGFLYLVFLLIFIRKLNRSMSDNMLNKIEAEENAELVKLSEERYRLLLNHSPVGIFHFNSNLVITYCNQTIIELLNSSFDRLEGLDMKLLIDQSFVPAAQQALTGETGTYEGPYKSSFGDKHLWVSMICAPSVDAKGNVVGGICIVQDNTERQTAAEEINNLAFYDPLTQLPNRRFVLDRLKQAIATSARSGRAGALLFIDLDNFKNLNDTFGHEIGDLLLQQVANRIEACVRDIDTVAHLSGDEFVVILEYLNDQLIDAAKQAEMFCEKIRLSLSAPYIIQEHEHHSTCSIGVSMFNNNQLAVDDLMKQADIAMYQAKKSGRNKLRFFDPRMQDEIDTHVALETELHKAIEHNEFRLHFQIQVDSTYRPLGAEALLRWQHPIRGLITPISFIPHAEETGLILPIGRWVLEEACNQLDKWKNHALTRDLVLSVNISASQFRQADFVSQVQTALKRHAINPRLLKLELTESLLLKDFDVVIKTMSELKEIGIQFALDDFGTGYSSLQYLKKLPLNQLKIDQSFVRDLVTDNSDKAIVTTIIAMAHSLCLDVIAEGVETEEQRNFLLEHQCTHFQGYLFSKPVPIEQFENLLQQIIPDTAQDAVDISWRPAPAT